MKNKKVLLIIIIVLVVAIAAVAYFLFLAPKNTELKTYFFSPGDAFVTNVLGTNRLIKTTMTLEITQDKATELTEKQPIIRDCIIYVLRSQTEEQFEDAELQTNLSNMILERLNALFPVEPKDDGEAIPLFMSVYFNDFVMQ